MNSLLILRALKQTLKQHKITYKELARSLGVTEAAIKKQFQSTDISFNRINMICDLMGISVSTLLQTAASKPIQELKLNKLQENYFIKNPRLFIFFLKLSEENGNSEKANVDLKMDSNELWTSLKTLDDIGLIKLHKKNKVELIYGSVLTISNANSAMELITNQLAQDYIRRHRDLRNPAKELKISLLKLSKKNADQLKVELNRTYELYLRQSEIDRHSLSDKDIGTYSMIFAVGEFSFI